MFDAAEMLALVRQSADDTLTYSVRGLIESYTEEVLPLASTIVQNLVCTFDRAVEF